MNNSRGISTLCILYVLVILLLSVTYVSADLRDWPSTNIPTFDIITKNPQAILDDWQTYLKPWQNYLIYCGLVLFVPLLAGIALCLAGCCIANCLCIFPAGKRKISKYLAVLIAFVPYLVAFILVVVATAISIGFFLWLMIGEIQIRKAGFDFVADVFNIPDKIRASKDDVIGIFSNLIGKFKGFVNGLDISGTLVETVNGFVADTKADVDGIKPHLDNIFNNFTAVKDVHGSLQAIGFPSLDFTQFNFPNSTTAINSVGSLSSLNSLNSTISSALGQVTNVKSQVFNVLDTLNGTMSDTIGQVLDKAIDLVDKGAEFVTSRVSATQINDYQSYVQLGEAAVGAVVIGILCICAILMAVGFICICIPACGRFALCCQMVWASFCLILYCVLASLFLIVWFLLSDACRQAEDYIPKVEKELQLPTYSINVPQGLPSPNLTISFSSAILGVLKCQGSDSFLTASGLTLEDFGIPAMIDSYKDQFSGQLDRFNISNIIGDSLNQLTSFNATNTLSSLNLDQDLSSLSSSLNGQFDTFIKDTFGVTYSKALRNASFEALFELLKKSNVDVNGVVLNASLPLTSVQVVSLNNGFVFPGIPTSTYPSGNPGTVPPSIASTDQFTVEEKIALYGQRICVPPASIPAACCLSNCGAGLVLNATVYAALESNSNFTAAVSGLESFTSSIENLDTSIKEAKNYLTGILDISSKVTGILDSVSGIYGTVKSNVTTFIDSTTSGLLNDITGISLLQCNDIGDFYIPVKGAICGNIKTSLGGYSFAGVLMYIFLSLIIVASGFGMQIFKRVGSTSDSDFDNEPY